MAEDITGTASAAGQAGDGGGQAGLEGQTGQAAASPAAGSSDGGQPAGGTTGNGSQEDVIFDPGEFDRLTKDLPAELQAQATALRKSLQGSYTKKTQAIANDRKKIDAYDAFYKDPVSQMQQMARQLGYNLTRGEAQAVAEQQQQNQGWEPKTWDDVMSRATEMAQAKILKQISPLLNEVQTMKKASVETQLDEIDPSWREYEDEMKFNLQDHPTLAKDPVKLYRMSVPPEVSESRAVQRAIRKLEDKASSSKVSGSSTTTKQPATGMPDKPVSFNEAVELARAKLAEQGMRAPGR